MTHSRSIQKVGVLQGFDEWMQELTCHAQHTCHPGRAASISTLFSPPPKAWLWPSLRDRQKVRTAIYFACVFFNTFRWVDLSTDGHSPQELCLECAGGRCLPSLLESFSSIIDVLEFESFSALWADGITDQSQCL